MSKQIQNIKYCVNFFQALFADRSKAGVYTHDKERMAQTEGKLESIGTKSHGIF